MAQLDLSHPIFTTFDGPNYVSWAQDMQSFLKGKKLWRIVDGSTIIPTQLEGEPITTFNDRFEDWDNKNHQNITWIRTPLFLPYVNNLGILILPRNYGIFLPIDTLSKVLQVNINF
ncbi:hypothetical protein ACH5RR_024257 [Cinchona calisaya]|uniref:DUF4219 domain-containing protein n=1 Tax=Cinchona calisaya TaxID=153742 RepID=A0ABD2YZP5_9GENT